MSNNKGNSRKYFEIIPHGTITSVPEFYAASCHCGVKKGKKDDICVIYTPLKTCCSGVFTTNKFLAAPVIICKEQLNNSRNIKAIVINSGIANACTGKKGNINAKKTIELAAKYLNIKKGNILISSTGIIGHQLPMEKIKNGIKYCSKNLNRDGGHNAAKAILTTDKVKKEIAVEVKINDNHKRGNIIIGGIAKGSGMIAPNMATMLCFVSANVKISRNVLDGLLEEGVEKSFNSITIDGCQSTNDMVIIQTNGQSGIEINNKYDKYFNEFRNALFFILKSLAKKLVKDGEGATKLIEISVIGARSKIDAKEVGMKIANSILFKTAIFGEDLNWGRIAAAIGSTDCSVNSDKVDLYIGDTLISKSGKEINFNKKHADKFIKKDEIKFTIDLNIGEKECKIWTTDLSYDYIKINSLYRS